MNDEIVKPFKVFFNYFFFLNNNIKTFVKDTKQQSQLHVQVGHHL